MCMTDAATDANKGGTCYEALITDTADTVNTWSIKQAEVATTLTDPFAVYAALEWAGISDLTAASATIS